MKRGLLALFCCLFVLSVGCQKSTKKKSNKSKKGQKSRYSMVVQSFQR